jgi:hypothetical protein
MEERFFTAETQADHGNYLAIQPTVNCYLLTQPDKGSYMNEMTELADLTDPTYWGEVIETAAIEMDWTAEQQAEWDAIYYALDPAATPLNDDFTTA